MITINPDKVKPKVPREVTMQQARRALHRAGKLAQVSSIISALPSPKKEEAQIKWEYSATVKRTDSLVLELAPALGLSSAALDQIFIDAKDL